MSIFKPSLFNSFEDAPFPVPLFLCKDPIQFKVLPDDDPNVKTLLRVLDFADKA